MTKISLSPYRGARDFYPEDLDLQKFMFDILNNVVRSYGYREYMGPILEPLELYQLKSGQELAKEQTYNFIDKGGRELAIRPEMTPTLSRMVAARRQQLKLPLRWYSIPNFWRYERPQKGRYREFWQLNVDLLGIDSYLAEFELICLIYDIFKGFKADPATYVIKVNHRVIINELLAYFGLTTDQAKNVIKIIDRKNKLPEDSFIEAIDQILNDSQRQANVVEQLLAILNTNQIESLPDIIKQSSSAQDLELLIKLLASVGVTNVKIDFNVIRGLDYYTGIVFEAFDLDPANPRAILGGGRYDGLIGMFGVDPLPTVGFGLGDAMLEEYLINYDLIPQLNTKIDFYTAILTNNVSKAVKMIQELRQIGLMLAVDYNNQKLSNIFKLADQQGIKQVLILGDKELNENKYTIRRLSDSQQTSLNIAEIKELVAKQSDKSEKYFIK